MVRTAWQPKRLQQLSESLPASGSSKPRCTDVPRIRFIAEREVLNISAVPATAAASLSQVTSDDALAGQVEVRG